MKKSIMILCAVFILMFSTAIAKDNTNSSNTLKGAAKDTELKNTASPQTVLTITDKDMTLGNRNAKVVIIEYSSLNCPHCSKFHQEDFNKLKNDFIDKGQVLYVYRDFPLNRVALAGSVLVHCAEKDKYFEFLNSLFESQSIWAFHSNYLDSLLNIAKLGGISEEKFKSCQNDKTLENFITKRMLDAANAFQINSTPTFFVNDEKIIGDKSYPEFREIIAKALKKAG